LIRHNAEQHGFGVGDVNVAVARTVHAHPSLPEAVREAALAVDGRAVHI
jgi:hypothetical protein